MKGTPPAALNLPTTIQQQQQQQAAPGPATTWQQQQQQLGGMFGGGALLGGAHPLLGALKQQVESMLGARFGEEGGRKGVGATCLAVRMPPSPEPPPHMLAPTPPHPTPPFPRLRLRRPPVPKPQAATVARRWVVATAGQGRGACGSAPPRSLHSPPSPTHPPPPTQPSSRSTPTPWLRPTAPPRLMPPACCSACRPCSPGWVGWGGGGARLPACLAGWVPAPSPSAHPPRPKRTPPTHAHPLAHTHAAGQPRAPAAG